MGYKEPEITAEEVREALEGNSYLRDVEIKLELFKMEKERIMPGPEYEARIKKMIGYGEDGEEKETPGYFDYLRNTFDSKELAELLMFAIGDKYLVPFKKLELFIREYLAKKDAEGYKLALELATDEPPMTFDKRGKLFKVGRFTKVVEILTYLVAERKTLMTKKLADGWKGRKCQVEFWGELSLAVKLGEVSERTARKLGEKKKMPLYLYGKCAGVTEASIALEGIKNIQIKGLKPKSRGAVVVTSTSIMRTIVELPEKYSLNFEDIIAIEGH